MRSDGPGGYVLLDLPTDVFCPSGGGSDLLRCQIVNGSPALSRGAQVPVLNGVRTGSWRDGWGELFSRDGVHSLGACYDTYLAQGGNGSRVVVFPIVSPAGTGMVEVRGYVVGYVSSLPVTDQLDVEVISAIVFGGP